MLHGSKAAKDSELTAQKTFADKSIGKNLPVIKIKKSVIASGVNILDVVIQTKLANSKGEIRRMIKNNGLRIKELYDLNSKKFNLKEEEGISSRIKKI